MTGLGLWLDVSVIGVALLALLAIGTPIVFALMLMGFGLITILVGSDSAVGIMRIIPYSSMLSFVLTAVPLFIFMAEALERTGFTEGLFDMLAAWLGRLPGGLAVSAVAGCTMFAAICGSSMATAVVIGKVAIPQMIERGYDRKLAIGPVTVAGGLGQLIPPSIPFILYGMITDTSVARLFMAGVFPGVMLATLYSFYIMARVWRSPDLAPRVPGVSLGKRIPLLLHAIPLVIIMAVVLGTIYAGVATPTESAAIGAFMVIIVCLLYRKLTWKNFQESLRGTVEVSCFALALVVGAMIFSYALTMAEIPQQLVKLVVGMQLNRWLVLIGIQVFLIVLGCFLDVGSCLLITLPIVFPIILSLGFDPIWFGALFIINLEMAVITPPVGLNLFGIMGAVPGITLSEIIRATIPFYSLVILGLILVMVFPGIATWLPSTMK